MKERRMYMRPKGRGFRVLWILLAMTAVPLLAAAWVAWGPGPAGDPGSAAFIGGSRYWRLLMADPAYQRLLALSALRVSVAAAGFPLSFGLRRGLRAASPRLRWGLPVGLMVLGAALSVWMAAAVRSAGVAASAQALWGAAAGGLLLVLGVSALILTMSESRPPAPAPRHGAGDFGRARRHAAGILGRRGMDAGSSFDRAAGFGRNGGRGNLYPPDAPAPVLGAAHAGPPAGGRRRRLALSAPVMEMESRVG